MNRRRCLPRRQVRDLPSRDNRPRSRRGAQRRRQLSGSRQSKHFVGQGQGTEMKLIHILALVAAMATIAAAQTTGAGNANSGGQQPAGKAPSATPTPPMKGSPATKQAVGAKKKALAGAAETTTGVPNSKKNAASTAT